MLKQFTAEIENFKFLLPFKLTKLITMMILVEAIYPLSIWSIF